MNGRKDEEKPLDLRSIKDTILSSDNAKDKMYKIKNAIEKIKAQLYEIPRSKTIELFKSIGGIKRKMAEKDLLLTAAKFRYIASKKNTDKKVKVIAEFYADIFESIGEKLGKEESIEENYILPLEYASTLMLANIKGK
ncbi:MAG: hypothetical protein QXD51_01360 [Candidatus Anstonellales archaeon]